ncbi:MAG TPA: efflux RND transporter periplasmic adaptor subunit [Enhygromyxa sp.]|nr:efflux RND transporter periplasmic adaptor subunit [Enhygromyxa sp.]
MRALRTLLSLLIFVVVLTGCTRSDGAAAKSAPPPVEVAVVTLEPTSVTLTRDLPGRVAALREAEVRARVDGIVEARLFTEGTDVEAGQELYRIEAAPYEAELAAAKANLARAEAAQVNAKLVAERDEELVKGNIVSREDQESSSAALRAANAEVAAARAAVKAAQINLQYTSMDAPIAGRIGTSEVTEGAYVQRSTATLMTTIQQLDTVYVYITQSSVELLRLRRALEANRLQRGDETELKLILEDGQEYAEIGKLDFSGATVDESTGSVSLRAVFSNPRRELLPGMFVRARIEQGTIASALLVPQRGVTRDTKGQAIALVVNADNVVERRELVAERSVDNAWLVSEGLAAGDRVIVEGIQKVRPGDRVEVVEAEKD